METKVINKAHQFVEEQFNEIAFQLHEYQGNSINSGFVINDVMHKIYIEFYSNHRVEYTSNQWNQLFYDNLRFKTHLNDQIEFKVKGMSILVHLNGVIIW